MKEINSFKKNNCRRNASILFIISGVLIFATGISQTLPEENKSPGAGNLLQEKVTLEYRNAPLVDVVRSISDTAKINIALSPAVTASNSLVTIRLANVTYDVALKTILDLFGLGATIENGILRIDSLLNIQTERKTKLALKVDTWRTEPTRVLIWQVNYAKSEELSTILSTTLRPFFQDPRFSIQSDKRSNKLIIEGVADALTRAKTLLEQLDKRKQQVLIEARIVEAASELAKTLSVTWGTRFGVDAQRGLSSGLVFPNSVVGNVGGAGALGGTAPSPGQGNRNTQLGTFGFTLGSINGMVNIDGILRAYETESMAHMVASPRIVVEDQEEAVMEESTSSQRYVFKNEQSDQQLTTSGMSLKVKPQITSDNTLELDLEVTRETPTNAPSDPVQGSTKRKAKTRLLVGNGDTAVIGGLYQTLKYKGQGRIPVLGRLPIIGFLFRTNDEATQKTELMVLITPRIVPVQNSLIGNNSTGPDIPVPANFSAPADANLKPQSSTNTAKNSANSSITTNSPGESIPSQPGDEALTNTSDSLPENGNTSNGNTATQNQAPANNSKNSNNSKNNTNGASNDSKNNSSL